MGLDMYLTKDTYYGMYGDRTEIEAIAFPKGVKAERVESVTERIAYWRKANAIHGWFVRNVQDGEDDCGSYDVSTTQLRELVALCQRVLDGTETGSGEIANGQSLENGKWADIMEPGVVNLNPQFAASLLPVAAGFFFGSTAYDEYYLDDLRETVDQLAPVLDEDGEHTTYYTYRASW